ncbi:MAG: hypothetical protein KJ574_01815, partial [Nanoarchaeota archaeon]|nr:hypothetical protein [Nanoarchaeota archaeon]
MRFPPPFDPFDPLIFIPGLVFTILAVIFCFLIYFKTRESYQLTKYKGLQYFRGAFLFFGLSYVLRFLFSLVILSSRVFDIFMPRGMSMPFLIMLLGYFSTIGIFYLIFCSIWKKFNNKHMLILGHSVAVVLSIVSFITRSHFILLALQCILLIVAIILSFVMHKKGRKRSNMRGLYVLVAV